MNAERIKELRELCEKATDGEWYITNGMQIASTSGGKYEIVTDQAMYESDAAFIAAARTAMPDLLDEVERLTDRLATQKKFLEHHVNNERMLNSQIMRMREEAAWTIPSVQMPDDGEEVMVIAKDTRTFQYRCFSPVSTYTWNETRYWQSNAILLKEVVCWKYAPTITATETVDE